MRILIASHSAVTLLPGGLHTQAISLQRELVRLGHQAELFDPWRDYSSPSHSSHPSPLAPHPSFDWFYLIGAHIGTVHLARSIKQAGMKLAVSPVFFSRHGPKALRRRLGWAGLWQGVARLWSATRPLVAQQSEFGMTREICRLADLVLPNTRAEAELVVGGLGIPGAKVKVVPNGCDERFYSATPEAFILQYGLPESAFRQVGTPAQRGGAPTENRSSAPSGQRDRASSPFFNLQSSIFNLQSSIPGERARVRGRDFVLYVGHVGHGRKNLLELIQAMKDIGRPLVIIGQVLNTDYARRCYAAAKELKDCLIIPGLPGDSELLASAYAACDIFCLPSLFETPGLAALEAALAGAKIVITRYGGTQEYFGEYARYVTPGAGFGVPRDLARHRGDLRRALDESLAAARTRELPEFIRTHFLWSHAAQKLVECLSNHRE